MAAGIADQDAFLESSTKGADFEASVRSLRQAGHFS